MQSFVACLCDFCDLPVLARGRDVGPEGEMLYGILIWVIVLALLDRGVKSLTVGIRQTSPLDRRNGIFMIGGGTLLGLILVYFRIPNQVFIWFGQAW